MKRLILSALLIAAIASLAQASIFVPAWRGDAGSTYQEWFFSTDDNPVVADMYNNAYGTPMAQIGGAFPFTTWYNDLNGAQGVWKTGDMIQLDIYNTPNTAIGTHKDIVVQAVYMPLNDAGLLAQISYQTSSEQGTVAAPVYSEILPNGYTYSRWEINLEPNPDFESIFILPPACNIYVDSMAVDTICVPEPATMALFGIAGLLLRRKK